IAGQAVPGGAHAASVMVPISIATAVAILTLTIRNLSQRTVRVDDPNDSCGAAVHPHPFNGAEHPRWVSSGLLGSGPALHPIPVAAGRQDLGCWSLLDQDREEVIQSEDR